MAVLDRGSTGCGKALSSSISPDRFELERIRLPLVFCVSVRPNDGRRDAIEPLCRTDA
jgi:hypothetical protein